MRNAPLALGFAAVLVIASAVLAIAATTTGPATASHLCSPAAPTPPSGPGPGGCGMDALSVDTDTTGNTATAVGTIENCIEVAAGASVTVDITAQGVPPFSDGGDADVTNDNGGLLGYGFDVGYDNTALSVTAVGTNFMLGVNAGSSIFNAGETTFPDTDGTYNASALDTGVSVPESGSGVLERMTIAVSGAAPAAQYTLSLVNGNHLDSTGTSYLPDVTNVGAIAVGVTCGAIPSPTPTASPLPTPTPSPTPVPTPSPSPSPSPTPSPTPCPTCTPSPSPSPTLAAGSASPSRTPTRAATPAALPPTGTGDSSGPAAPIVLGAASIIVIATALGGYEITRRMKREA